MDIDDHQPPHTPSDDDGEDNEGMEEGGEGHTQESTEDLPDEDVEMESRSYCNNDTVYGVPRSQSTDTDVCVGGWVGFIITHYVCVCVQDQQESNTEVKDGNQLNEQEMSNDVPNSSNGTVTTGTCTCIHVAYMYMYTCSLQYGKVSRERYTLQ